MRLALLLLLISAPLFAQTASGTYVIDAEAWAAPRTGERLLAMPPLRAAVDALQARPGSRLVIHYPGGENGQVWVQELRSWLIALGIPSSRIELLPGGTRDDRLVLEVDS